MHSVYDYTSYFDVFFSEKWAHNEVESQNVKGNQRYKIIIKGT